MSHVAGCGKCHVDTDRAGLLNACRGGNGGETQIKDLFFPLILYWGTLSVGDSLLLSEMSRGPLYPGSWSSWKNSGMMINLQVILIPRLFKDMGEEQSTPGENVNRKREGPAPCVLQHVIW